MHPNAARQRRVNAVDYLTPRGANGRFVGQHDDIIDGEYTAFVGDNRTMDERIARAPLHTGAAAVAVPNKGTPASSSSSSAWFWCPLVTLSIFVVATAVTLIVVDTHGESMVVSSGMMARAPLTAARDGGAYKPPTAGDPLLLYRSYSGWMPFYFTLHDVEILDPAGRPVPADRLHADIGVWATVFSGMSTYTLDDLQLDGIHVPAERQAFNGSLPVIDWITTGGKGVYVHKFSMPDIEIESATLRTGGEVRHTVDVTGRALRVNSHTGDFGGSVTLKSPTLSVLDMTVDLLGTRATREVDVSVRAPVLPVAGTLAALSDTVFDIGTDVHTACERHVCGSATIKASGPFAEWRELGFGGINFSLSNHTIGFSGEWTLAQQSRSSPDEVAEALGSWPTPQVLAIVGRPTHMSLDLLLDTSLGVDLTTLAIDTQGGLSVHGQAHVPSGYDLDDTTRSAVTVRWGDASASLATYGWTGQWYVRNATSPLSVTRELLGSISARGVYTVDPDTHTIAMRNAGLFVDGVYSFAIENGAFDIDYEQRRIDGSIESLNGDVSLDVHDGGVRVRAKLDDPFTNEQLAALVRREGSAPSSSATIEGDVHGLWGADAAYGVSGRVSVGVSIDGWLHANTTFDRAPAPVSSKVHWDVGALVNGVKATGLLTVTDEDTRLLLHPFTITDNRLHTRSPSVVHAAWSRDGSANVYSASTHISRVGVSDNVAAVDCSGTLEDNACALVFADDLGELQTDLALLRAKSRRAQLALPQLVVSRGAAVANVTLSNLFTSPLVSRGHVTISGAHVAYSARRDGTNEVAAHVLTTRVEGKDGAWSGSASVDMDDWADVGHLDVGLRMVQQPDARNVTTTLSVTSPHFGVLNNQHLEWGFNADLLDQVVWMIEKV